MDPYALAAWTARVVNQALRAPLNPPYVPGSVDLAFMRDVARLSWAEQGPVLACQFLSKHGITVVIEPHLTHTHLDGAAILLDVGRPVIGLTIRHDRLDNFWFCLMHELAHISLHLTESRSNEPSQFFDNLDPGGMKDSRESDADRQADEALIPEAEWTESPASVLRTREAVEHLATKLRIHPAIVAGRMRYRGGSYRVLGDMIGQGTVRSLFPHVPWDKVA